MTRHPPRILLTLAAWVILAAAAPPARAFQFINAYTNEQSYAPGDTVYFHVSTQSPAFNLEIIRDSAEPLVVASFPNNPGAFYAIPPSNGWLGANWPVARSWVVPPDAPSGSYFARFTTTDGTTWHHPFVIRPAVPGAVSRLAFVMAYNTRNAYNPWGGKSLYVSNVPNDTRHAVKVSFQRPYSENNGRGKGYFPPQVVYSQLETDGFVLEYITEWDIESIPNLLDAYHVLIFVGHHEYISRPIFDAIQAFHDRGAHFAVFSGNDFWWQVRYEDNGHIMVGYRNYAIPEDPLYGVNDDLVTTRWGSELISRPGEALQGVAFLRNLAVEEAEDYRVRMASHWIFAGTGLQDGDVFGSRLVIGEVDYLAPASPPVMDVVLSGRTSVVSGGETIFVDACAIYYEDSPAYGFPAGRGGKVFSSGTQFWTSAMQTGQPGYQQVRQVTRNIIQHMLDSPPPPLAPTDTSGTQPKPRLPLRRRIR